MIKSYFTLYALTLEMKSRFEGGYIFEAFSQEKNELRLCIIAPDKERYTLFATASTTKLSLYFSETFQRQKRNSVSLMTKANDKQIKSIRISDCERIIYFELEDALTLAFQFFSAETNFFLLEHGIVQESFKKQPSLLNQPFVEDSHTPILPALEQLTNDLDAFLHTLDYQSFIARSAKEQERWIPKKLIGFDTYLAREMLFRTRSSSPTLEPNTLHQVFQEMFYELISPEPKVYFSDNDIWLSLIPPTHLPYLRAESFNSVDEAIRFYTHQIYQHEHFTKQLISLKKSLERLIEKTDAQIRTMSALQTTDRAEMYETFGKLLLLHLHHGKGLSEIELENIFSQGERIKIPLDAAKSIQENAESYFERAKKSRQQRKVAEKRLHDITQKFAEQKRLLAELSEVTSPKLFKAWKEKNLQWLKQFGLLSVSEAEKEQRFRRFKISPQVELWVGKNAQSNDLLTFKYARPNDLWLHARGVSGSHCVLKSPSKPSKDDILRAAEIAAYYSSARTSELVPVICTEKKYVRKPKGAPAGSVVVERENVLMVTPRLLLEED
jgi:predicted ribosome quality control (RQC) complex YloA/Tae2 family protein